MSTTVRRRLRGTQDEVTAQIRDADARGALLWLGNGRRYPNGLMTVEVELRAERGPTRPVSLPVPRSAADRSVDALMGRSMAKRPAEWPVRDRRWVPVLAWVTVTFAALAITSAAVGIVGTLGTILSAAMLAARLFGIGGSRRGGKS
jgi:hypothetical protein